MKRTISKSFAVLVAVVVLFTFSVSVHAFAYIHDPMQNPKAAVDIVVNPDAVYGYSPNPDSPRLGTYADYDWTDEAVVAELREQREEYHDSIKELYQMKADMEAEGKSVEEIARAVSTRRNEIRMEAYKDDPEGLEKLKESNLKTFGNENGGTPDYFYQKYGSWETVIEKAFSTNAGADACLGLYDKYYDTYFIDDDGKSTDDESIKLSETAAVSTADQTDATIDSTVKSPKTGDHSVAVIWLIIAMTGVAVICIVALKQNKEH